MKKMIVLSLLLSGTYLNKSFAQVSVHVRVGRPVAVVRPLPVIVAPAPVVVRPVPRPVVVIRPAPVVAVVRPRVVRVYR
jgi:hypothetical protein